MDLDLAIALLALSVAYWLNWYIGHRPVNMIRIWHLFHMNKKSHIGGKEKL
jgi:hypothetical protein